MTTDTKTTATPAPSLDAIKAKAIKDAKARQNKVLGKVVGALIDDTKKAVKAKAKAKVKAKAKTKPAKPAANKVEIKVGNGTPVMMRKGSKQARMYELLMRNEGASVAEIAKACDYEHGTAMSAVHGGRLKRFLKTMGGQLIHVDLEKRGRCFRIVAKKK